MSDDALKIEFAKLLLKFGDPFKAALQLIPADTGQALRIANEWPLDPLVISNQCELLGDDDEFSFLPTKADFARKILSKMDDDRICPDDYAKLGRLYADVRGFIDKPQTNINTNLNNLIQNNVMVIRENGSDEEWEEKLRRQQERLVNGSTCD